MRVTFNQNNIQPNFQSVNLVQVSKRAFRSPDNLSSVYIDYLRANNKAAGEIGPWSSTLLAWLGWAKDQRIIKTVAFLESPFHILLKWYCKKCHTSDLTHLGQRFGVELRDAVDPNYHSFYVLTHEDKNNVADVFIGKKPKDMKAKIQAQIAQRRGNVTSLDSLYDLQAETYARLDNLAMESIKKPEKVFRIDDLSQLPDVFKQIDY